MFIIQQIKQIWQKRHLLYYLTSYDIQELYKGKFLGILWSVLDPLFLMLVYVILVKFIFQRGDAQYPVLLFSCLLSWRWFSQSVLTSSRIIQGQGRMLQTVNFPPILLPLSKVISNFIQLLYGLVVLFPMLYLFDADFSLNMLYLPLLLALQFFFVAGAAFISAILGLYFKDTFNILQFVIRMLFYLSPGLFGLSLIPKEYLHPYLLSNPFASLFSSFKNVLVHGTTFNNYIWVFAIWSVVFFLFGTYLFHRNKNIVKLL